MIRLIVRRPGLLTTVQDLGRRGLGRFGVSRSGALDALALRVANRLVGNVDGAPALEITVRGPEVEFPDGGVVALAGADLSPTVDGRPVPVWCSLPVGAGAVLAFGPRRRGARAVLAVAGGLDVPALLGSAATDIEAGLGSSLRANQELRTRGSARSPARAAGVSVLRAWAEPFVLRFVPAPEPAAAAATDALARAVFRVSRDSNRMGIRLDGPSLPAIGAGTEISEPVPPGTIQVPSDGRPTLLLADGPTVGGYPRIGYVIEADAPKVAQLWIGHEVRFRPVGIDEAHAALREQEEWLERSVPAC
ncbi:MAG: biotin-dependent carboxyltransferase family protein [Acidobacteriota bacterium]